MSDPAQFNTNFIVANKMCCNYSNYKYTHPDFNNVTGDAMEKHVRSRNIKIVPIGNSMGVRLPKNLLQKYGFANSLILEETDKGLLLRKNLDNKLSLTDTYKAMGKEHEDWSDYDSTLPDGLEEDD
jgi:antitoxin MazE